MTKSERKGCNGQEVPASPSNATRSVTLERELRAAQSEAQAANGRVDEIRQSTERQLNKLRAEGEQGRMSQVRRRACGRRRGEEGDGGRGSPGQRACREGRAGRHCG